MKKIVLLICAAVVSFGALAQQDVKPEKKRGTERKVIIKGDEKNVKPYQIEQARHFAWMGIPNLTEEQKTKLKDLQTAYTKETRHTNNLLNEKKARLKTLQDEENINQSSVNKTIDEMMALQGQLMKARVDHKIKVRAMLTPEQREAYERFGGRAFMIRGGNHNFNVGRFPAFGEDFQWKDFDWDFKVDFDPVIGETSSVATWSVED